MNRVLAFDIILTSSTGIFRPGDVIDGCVYIKTNQNLPVHGIHLWVLGQADVSWAEKAAQERSHFEYEIYMKDCIILWGRDPRNTLRDAFQVLQAGVHEYTFQYRLPQRLPSTFESEDPLFKGRVHYQLRARLDSPDDAVRQHCDTAFIVLAALDLNKEHCLTRSVQERKVKVTHCCCCRTGSIRCMLRLNRTGYVPGEDINLDAEIQNQSKKEVDSSYVTMQQIVSYFAQGQSRSHTCDIFRISGGKIRSGDSAFYHDIIHIPPLPPSRLDHCRLIHIQYVIKVGVKPSGDADDVEVTIPITVGTIPLISCIPPNVTLSPLFSRYSHCSGEIEDYTDADYRNGRHQHVYIYYKSLYVRQPPAATEVT